MQETHENRLKRMKMRSMRRGIKEMDIILSRFANAKLDSMTEAQLDHYDALLAENDQDLYQWVSGQTSANKEFSELVDEIAAFIASDK